MTTLQLDSERYFASMPAQVASHADPSPASAAPGGSARDAPAANSRSTRGVGGAV